MSTLGDWSNILLSVVIFLLAFSSILGNYYYGESNIGFLSSSKKVMFGFRSLVVALVLVGTVASTEIVWNLADGIMGVMAIINLVAIALLAPTALKLLKDYTSQRKQGLDPVFTRDKLPHLTGIDCWEDERTVTGPINLDSRRGR